MREPISIINGRGEPMIRLDVAQRLGIACGKTLVSEIPKIMSELKAEAVKTAETLDEAALRIGTHLGNIRPMKKEILEELRGMRMASASEVSLMIKPLEDIRQFFLSEKHAEEVKRLREFVDLCERLEKLKQSGFLDAVSDTILKLS